ncbi:hypothetical protein L1049_024489 [Liquidambar formosana]|uniref:SAP domain-containing protein n=1 Tax=Liquidambar formosana TaxID=63359 RepID=A0AAP0RVW2_LIQFO
MAERKRKPPTVVLSSEEEEEEEEEDDDDDEDDEEEDDDNGGTVSTSSDDGSICDDEEEDESDDQEESDDEDLDGDDESLCNRVTRFLQERKDLQALNLTECKAYLRKHDLRITGTKAVCIQRIKEHWRIKDGNCEALYPRSSFVINCTGDVCKGDVVLFTQKVYEKFDKVTRSGRILGKRTIAGRVVKESYGAAKQQHTFTVEILWSKGIKRLPPLFPLLVKGRNLYRLKTFRQRWNNEAERLKVLAEKHKRGAAARLVRAMKKTKKTGSNNGGLKHQKNFHHTEPSRMKQATEGVRGKHVDGCGKAPSLGLAKSNNRHQKASPLGQVNSMKITKSTAPKSSWRHRKPAHGNKEKISTFQSYPDPAQNFYQSQMGSHHRNVPSGFSSYELGTGSTMMRLPPFRSYADSSVRLPPFRSYGDSYMMPAPGHRGFDHSNYTHHANPSYYFDPRINHHPRPMNIDRPWQPFPSGRGTYGQRN